MKNTIIAAALALTLPGIAFAENNAVVSTGGVVAPSADVAPVEAQGSLAGLPPYAPLLIAGAATLGAAALVLGDSRDSSGATTTTTTTRN